MLVINSYLSVQQETALERSFTTCTRHWHEDIKAEAGSRGHERGQWGQPEWFYKQLQASAPRPQPGLEQGCQVPQYSPARGHVPSGVTGRLRVEWPDRWVSPAARDPSTVLRLGDLGFLFFIFVYVNPDSPFRVLTTCSPSYHYQNV